MPNHTPVPDNVDKGSRTTTSSSSSSLRRSPSASSLLACGTHHVFDRDPASSPRTFHLGEVHTQFLRFLPGSIRGVRFFLDRLGLGLILVLLRALLGDFLYGIA